MKYETATKKVVQYYRERIPKFKFLNVEFTDSGRFAIIKNGQEVCEGSLTAYLTIVNGMSREEAGNEIRQRYEEILKGGN